MALHHRYSDFAPRIDIDTFEESIGFSPIEDDGKGNDVGYCPDPWGMHKHGDTTGKFAIHREKKLFNCWVCDGGTLLSLGMAVWDVEEDEAIDKLLAMCGEPTDERFEDEIEELLWEDESRRHNHLPYFNAHVLDKTDRKSEVLKDFVLARHISLEVAKEHKLAYNPEAERRHKKHDTYYGPGIIFPHFWQGHLVGWQTRWLESDEERPNWVQKYHNTRDFPKKHTIYNYEKVYLSPDPIVIVESVPTALVLESLGFPAVAMFGASVPPEQLELLRSCQQGLILAPDNDDPGEKMITKSIKYLDPYVPVRVCEPVGEEGSGDDLGDLSDPQDVIEIVGNAVDLGLI